MCVTGAQPAQHALQSRRHSRTSAGVTADSVPAATQLTVTNRIHSHSLVGELWLPRLQALVQEACPGIVEIIVDLQDTTTATSIKGCDVRSGIQEPMDPPLLRDGLDSTRQHNRASPEMACYVNLQRHHTTQQPRHPTRGVSSGWTGKIR